MSRTISIGAQDFVDIRKGGYLYVDKTGFIRDWWKSGDVVTLICRPRRSGKTLALSTVKAFFSTEYASRGTELFDGLNVWNDKDLARLQGTIPVVSLSFANVKRQSLELALCDIRHTLAAAVSAHAYLQDSDAISESDRAFLAKTGDDMDDLTATTCLGRLCGMLNDHWGVKPILLLDEYDTPMQEAWINGYWDDMSAFMCSLFNSTFKTNPSLGRGLITGITRVASESIFSDLNNLSVVTVTTPAYESDFGFTQAEVDSVLTECGMVDIRNDVREWYDGFQFGHVSGIYNPWSLTNCLRFDALGTYWVNSSSNALVSSIVRRSGNRLKQDFETLLSGGSIVAKVNENVTFDNLYSNPTAVWTLLLATGYLRAIGAGGKPGEYALSLTNREVREGFDDIVSQWFEDSGDSYGEFAVALLAGDIPAMNRYLGEVATACISSFDSATHPSETAQPERFWHGLVLGLLVDLRGRYSVESNRKSGFGRYDVMLVPNDGAHGADPAIILEFKVLDAEWSDEKSLADTVAAAHKQIREKRYATALAERGIVPARIREYGIAFQGKNVLVG